MEEILYEQEGEIRKNIYGDWSDVDKGIFINQDEINTIFTDLIGKKVKIQITSIEEED